jgi:hypothetical protein
MRFVFRALVGLALLGCAALAQAQQVNVAGTARGIPFASNCNPGNVSYAFTGGQVQVAFACNGISYSCMAMPLPEDETQVVSFTLGAPSRLKLNCGGATTITGLQTYIADFYASLQQFLDTPPPGGPTIPDRMCIALQGSTVSAVNYDANTRLLTYTCSTGTQNVASACFMTSSFGYDSGGGTLIVPDCIDATNPLDSPYLFQNGYEGSEA